MGDREYPPGTCRNCGDSILPNLIHYERDCIGNLRAAPKRDRDASSAMCGALAALLLKSGEFVGTGTKMYLGAILGEVPAATSPVPCACEEQVTSLVACVDFGSKLFGVHSERIETRPESLALEQAYTPLCRPGTGCWKIVWREEPS